VPAVARAVIVERMTSMSVSVCDTGSMRVGVVIVV